MSVKIVSVTSVLAACVAGAAIAFGPAALAEEPDDCALGGTAIVCNPSVPAPPQGDTGGRGPGGTNNQNGAYGPAGDAPPVGGGQ
jgi:hypothetical protein